MIAGLPLSFTEPLLLLGLLSLPALWWLLRVMPPRPRRVEFPPTRLLFDIAPKEETPSRTPWWLTALRLLAAALVIFAAAGPIWNPQTGLAGSKAPLMIMHGVHDRIVPYPMGERLFDLANQPKHIVRFLDGGHEDLDANGALNAVARFLAGDLD